MKELRKKTFVTIFSILSLIIVVSLILINVQNYSREKEGIKRNLDIFDDFGKTNGPDGNRRPFMMQFSDTDRNLEKEDFGKFEPEQMMIADYEVYTVEVTGGEVSRIISHGNASDDFDIQNIAESILKENDPGSEEIGNLFFSGYSYNYKWPERLTVSNNREPAVRLRRYLLVTLAVFGLFEALFVFISKRITDWIIKPAQESFKKQKEFIADASHELKSPLAVIVASADELSETDGKEKEKEGKLIENIRYESDRMNRLIAQLLNLSKLEEGLSGSHTEEDISKLLEKTVLAFEAVAFETGVGIETDIKKHVIFNCNKEEMEKLFSTILDNAVRHSYKDTSVLAELKESGNQINIRIVNKGEPIPKGEEERIFERFYRGDESRNRTDNRYGLGLAIAASIVKNHHGKIKARSENGSTEFEIRLKK